MSASTSTRRAADDGPPAARPFGTTHEGEVVEAFTLANATGAEARIMTFGAVLLSLRVPDRDGRLDDVVLGFDTLAPYLEPSAYFGAVVGRYANRIAGARFILDGAAYALAANDGPNHLHGGRRGFDRRLWRAAPFRPDAGAALALTLRSPDGEEGYPGTLDARVTYTLTDGNALMVDYEATTDRPTVVNLTQHSYFNLAGAGCGDVLGHRVTIHADRYTPVTPALIPTGELAPVAGTPLDFRTPHTLRARIGADHAQLRIGRGYDHNFVLGHPGAGALAHAAHVEEPASGRTLDVRTTEPGMQLYSGNFLEAIAGKGGRRYGPRSGFCLETQHFPDSPNQPHFPSTVLRPGERYRSRTVFAFGVAG